MLSKYPPAMSYQQNSYYQPSYQRYAQLEAQQQLNPQFDLMNSTGQPGFLKGRPVVSLEEARAAQIDLDGSLFIFTDLGNSKIYTKQINLEGVAVLKTYELVENSTPQSDYVTRAELDKIISAFKQEFSQNNNEREINNEPINKQQSGATQSSVRKQSAF